MQVREAARVLAHGWIRDAARLLLSDADFMLQLWLTIDPATHALATELLPTALTVPGLADAIAPGGIDAGHTAWILMSCALVNFMTPGLAFFYGGLVRRNHVLRVAASSTVTRVPRHSES